MATGTIILSPAGATLPDGSTNNAAAQFVRVKSSAAAPSLHFLELAFDSAADEHAYWSWEMPSDYASGGVVTLLWKANATSGNVVWGARLAAITPADAETPNEKALAAATTVTTGVNATEARRLVSSSITLGNLDSVAAGDWVVLLVYRDADNASDTLNANDAELVSVMFEYTTT